MNDSNNEIKKENKESFITTFDNPYNYFTQFDEWLAFDRNHGYYTLEYVARLCKTSDELGEEQQRKDLEDAFDSIIRWNGEMYKKVYKPD